MELTDKIKHQFFRARTRLADQPLNRPSAREAELVDNLRTSFKHFRATDDNTGDQTELYWQAKREQLRTLVIEEEPRAFLRWPAIEQTMCVGDFPYVVTELRHLQKQPDWLARWEPAIQESNAGHPRRFAWYPASSGTLIHHAYHLSCFEETTGLTVDKMDAIAEFGGGYGSMCRLVHSLGFKGTYIIFDLPELCALQRFFLSLTNQPVLPEHKTTQGPGIISVPETERFRSLVANVTGRRMFIGTWSISEAPIELRKLIMNTVSSFDGVLIGYQEQFGDIDNTRFFSQWSGDQAERYESADFAIQHLPGNRYLMAKCLNTR
jgi:hypothetical protein